MATKCYECLTRTGTGRFRFWAAGMDLAKDHAEHLARDNDHNGLNVVTPVQVRYTGVR